MHRKIFCFLVLTVLASNAYSQDKSDEKFDSMFVGRKCQVILFNGYQVEGVIKDKSADTLWFKAESSTLKIPIKDIKFVTEPEVDISEIGEVKYKAYEPQEKIPDTTDDCDVYLSGNSLLIGVTLYMDTSLHAVKENKIRNVKFEDVRKVVFKPIAPFGKGFLWGAAIGFLTGFIPTAFAKGGGHPDYSGPGIGILFGLVLAIPCGLIGGVIGLLASSDEVYYFDEGVTPAKIKRIKYIIDKHKQ